MHGTVRVGSLRPLSVVNFKNPNSRRDVSKGHTVDQDTIPSQLFPDEERLRPRSIAPKAPKIGVVGFLIIATLIALAGMVIARLIHMLLRQ